MKFRTYTRGTLLALLAAAAVLASPPVFAKTRDKDKGEQKEEAAKDRSLLRVPNSAYEVLKNKVSGVEFYSSNYGIFGLNVATSQAGGIWPRGSNRRYIFGGGIWFAAEKVLDNQGKQDTAKLCVIGYNPNSGTSWMTPGIIQGDIKTSKTDVSPAAISKYRLYLSSDYNGFTGEPFDSKDKAANGPNWPIWDTNPNDTLKHNRYFGNYIDDLSLRNTNTYRKGPAIISGEDIFSIYKDTDLDRYKELSSDVALKKGYPIGIQVEQSIYGWGFGQYKNFLFIKYSIINKSGQDLLNCFMGPALDMDIGQANNDHAKIFIPEADKDTLNLAIQWSDAEATVYGYIGLDFLESPAIDSTGFLRPNKAVYPEKEQIGLSTFQAWTIDEDPSNDQQRYEFMSDRSQRDQDNGPGDKRFMMTTGPFNMHKGDTARVVVGIVFANGGKDPNNPTTPTGQTDDVKNLLAIDTFAQKVYNENFLAPVPPDPSNVTWSPLNNGVELHWDDRSERSLDRQERGLDFARYQIRRSRKGVSGDITDSTHGWNLGWKTIGTFVIPPMPDTVTRYKAALEGNLSRLGAWSILPMLADTGSRGLIKKYNKFRIDTLKRPGQPDLLQPSKTVIDTGYVVDFTFDPFDDNDDDSTHFNGGQYGGRFANKANRDIVRDAIVHIMDSITAGRTFIDVGDDNNDGKIEENQIDLSQNEKLINNVDYYYQVLALDAGSDEGTPAKVNSGIAGLNEVRTTPEAPQSGADPNPTILSSNGLGGIYNFRFVTYDKERLAQLFGGDTLEFEFQPLDPFDSAGIGHKEFINLFYNSQVIVRSKKSGGELMRFALNYGNLFSSPAGRFTDRSDTTIRLLDSLLTTQHPDSGRSFYSARNIKVPYFDSYNADPLFPIYSTVGIYKNTFGIGFDYAFEQFGDSLRFGRFGDSTNKSPFTIVTGNDPGKTNLVAGKQLVGQLLTAASNTDIAQRIPSIGQVKLEIEFMPGGTETISYKTKTGARPVSFNVDYLTLKVRDIASFTRKVFNTSGTQVDSTINYNYEFPADPNAKVKIDTLPSTGAIARVIDPGKYALYANAWQNSDAIRAAGKLTNLVARNKSLIATQYLGTPNRYYVDDPAKLTIDTIRVKFTHKLVVNGAEIYLDYAGMGPTTAQFDTSQIPASAPTTDFKVGDKIVVDFTGGTLGLPVPGAKVSVAIPETKVTLQNYTDDLLDKVTVVPNPYLIDHVGQPTTTDRRIYFTHLPEQCTIQIFTEAGELVQTLEHDALAKQGDANYENGRVAVEVYDLLTKANRIVQSQLLVARITTPNGAETVKKFAVIVGGYRLNTR
ncbi:MAG: Fibronectin type domain protein [Chlorobi bacterium]|nr:Fibronectin type domain protein [Chlorobiota bacterium]